MVYKEYYETQEFADIANIDKKTVGRLKKQLIEENPQTKKIKYKSKPHKFHYSLLKNYLSPSIFSVLQLVKSQRNTINCLMNPDTLGYKFFQMDWTWWCTVAYERELTSDACRQVMDKFYSHIETIYGDDSKLRLYYTTESFSSREGNHNHFVLNVSNPEILYDVKSDMEKYFDGNRLHIDNYDKYQPCIFYSEKEGLRGTAWNIYGNNLIEDGIRYENKS